MAVQGSKKESREIGLRVGVFEAQIEAINPSREQLEKLLGGVKIEKDPEYLKDDDKDNCKVMNLSIWLKEVEKGGLFNLRFYLKDKERTNKNEDKFQYIDNIGTTAWADEPENLPAFFVESGRPYRKAKVGEEELYKFIRNWLSDLNYKDPETNLDAEWSKLMRGNVKPLLEMKDTPFTKNIVCLATVRTGEDSEGKPKDYQQVYNREFLPEYAMKFFIHGGAKTPKVVTRFIENVEDPEYGCKDFFGLELKPLHDYNPEENIATADTSAISEDGPDLGK